MRAQAPRPPPAAAASGPRRRQVRRGCHPGARGRWLRRRVQGARRGACLTSLRGALAPVSRPRSPPCCAVAAATLAPLPVVMAASSQAAAGSGSSRAATLGAVRAARGQLVAAAGAARRSVKTGVFKPGSRMRDLLRSITAPSALASEPEALVWDPLLAAARLPGGLAELAAYLQFVRNTVCGQDEQAKAAMARRVRADWARATGGFDAADYPPLELPPGAASFLPGIGGAAAAPQPSAAAAAAAAANESPSPAAAAAAAAPPGIAAECYPSSLDEAALVFLHLHHFDVSRAQLLLAAYLGGGRELAAIQQLEDLRGDMLLGGGGNNSGSGGAPPQRGGGRGGTSARAASAVASGGQDGAAGEAPSATSIAAAAKPRAKPSSHVGGSAAGSALTAAGSSTREAGGLGTAVGVAPGDACVLAGVAGSALEPEQLDSHALRAAWGEEQQHQAPLRGPGGAPLQHVCEDVDVDALPYTSVLGPPLGGGGGSASSSGGAARAPVAESSAHAADAAGPVSVDTMLTASASDAASAAVAAPTLVHALPVLAAFPANHLTVPSAEVPAPLDAPFEEGASSSMFDAPAPAADVCGDEDMEAPLEASLSASSPPLPTATSAVPAGAYKTRMSEPQRQRMWKQWLVDARVVLQSRSSSWDSLVHLRASAAAIPLLNPFASGGGSAVLAGEVTQACSTIGTRLKSAVRWRARVRDALCGTLSAPGPAPLVDFEELLADAGRCQVDMTEPAHLGGFIREAKEWLREADELLRRSVCAASEAVKAELLHLEDAALAGPEGAHVPMPGVRTASISDVPPRPPKGGGSSGHSSSAALAAATDERPRQQATSSKKATPPLLEPLAADQPPAPGSTEKAGRSLRAKRSRPADIADDHAAGSSAGADGDEQQAAALAGLPGVKAARSRGGAAATQPPPVALFYSSRYAALQHAEVAQPPVFIDELVALRIDARSIPICLHPQAADVETKLRRCRELAAQIVAHLPNASSPQHSRGPGGPRLPQAHGLSADVLGSVALAADGCSGAGVVIASAASAAHASSGAMGAGAAASAAAALSGASHLDHDPAGLLASPAPLGGSGSLADGSAAYASYHAFNSHPHGSGISALLSGSGRRARMPWSHLDALARDVRETGVAFCEGEVVKLVHAEALNWLARSHEAVSYRRRCTLPELRELLAEAEALPVDMTERVAVLRVEVRRAEAWVSAAHELVRPRSIGPQSTRTSRTVATGPSSRSSGSALLDVKHALEQVASGLVAASDSEVASLESTVLSAQAWLTRVTELLDRDCSERALPLVGAVPGGDAAADRPSGSSMPPLRDGVTSSLAAFAGNTSARSDDAASAIETSDSSMDGAPAAALTIDRLTALLREADDIPIALEEYELLAAEVAARKWAGRARKHMCQPSGAKLEALRELLKDIKSVRQGGNGSSSGKSSGGGEGGDGHQGGAQHAHAALARLPILAEEREIKQVLKSAEELLARVKRLQSTMISTGGSTAAAGATPPAVVALAPPQPQRRVEVARVCEVLLQAAALPVNLTAYTLDLSDAVERCRAWEAAASIALARVRAAMSAAAALRALRAAMSLAARSARSGAVVVTSAEPHAEAAHVAPPTLDNATSLATSSPAAVVASSHSIIAAPSCASVLADDSSFAGEQAAVAALSALRALPPLSLDHLRDLVADADALPCIPEGDQELRAALTELDAWLQVSADVLPLPSQAQARQRDDQMVLEEEAAASAPVSSEGQGAAASTASVAAREITLEQLSSSAVPVSAVPMSAKVPVEFLRRVLEGSMALPVNVDARSVRQLVVAYHAARKWQLSARATLVRIGALALPSVEERLGEAAFDVTLALSTGVASTWLPDVEGCAWSPSPPLPTASAARAFSTDAAFHTAAFSLPVALLLPAPISPSSSSSSTDSLSQTLEMLQVGCRGLVVLCKEEVALHHALALDRWSTRARSVVALFDAHRDRVMSALMLGVTSASHFARLEGGSGASPGDVDEDHPSDVAALHLSPAGLRHHRPSDLPVVTAPHHITWDSLLARRLDGSAAVMAAAFWISRPHYGATNADATILRGTAASLVASGSSASSVAPERFVVDVETLAPSESLADLLREADSLGIMPPEAVADEPVNNDEATAASAAGPGHGHDEDEQSKQGAPDDDGAVVSTSRGGRGRGRGGKWGRGKRVARAGRSARGSDDETDGDDGSVGGVMERCGSSSVDVDAVVPPAATDASSGAAAGLGAQVGCINGDASAEAHATAAASGGGVLAGANDEQAESEGGAESEPAEGSDEDSESAAKSLVQRRSRGGRGRGRGRGRSSAAVGAAPDGAGGSMRGAGSGRGRGRGARAAAGSRAASVGLQRTRRNVLDSLLSHDDILARFASKRAEAAAGNLLLSDSPLLAAAAAAATSALFTRVGENSGDIHDVQATAGAANASGPSPGSAFMFDVGVGAPLAAAVSGEQSRARHHDESALRSHALHSSLHAARAKLLAALQRESSTAAKWHAQVETALAAPHGSVALPSALALLSHGVLLAVRLPHLRVLQAAIEHSHRLYVRSLLLLPPCRQVLALDTCEPAASSSTSSSTRHRVIAAYLSRAAEDEVLDYGPQLSHAREAASANAPRGQVTRIFIDNNNQLRIDDASNVDPARHAAAGAVAPQQQQQSLLRPRTFLALGPNHDSSTDPSPDIVELRGMLCARATAAAADGDVAAASSSDEHETAALAPRPSVDALEAALAASAASRLALPITKLLRGELRHAKRWLEEARRAASAAADLVTGGGPREGLTAEVGALVSSSARVWADVSVSLERLLTSCSLFCVCRQPFASPMVECPSCQQPYHHDCVGFQQAGAGHSGGAPPDLRGLSIEMRRFRCPPCATQAVLKWQLHCAGYAVGFLAAQLSEQVANPAAWRGSRGDPATPGGHVICGGSGSALGRVAASSDRPEWPQPPPAHAGAAVLDFDLPPPASRLSLAASQPSQVVAPSYSLLPWLGAHATAWLEAACAVLDPANAREGAMLRTPSHVRALIAQGVALAGQPEPGATTAASSAAGAASAPVSGGHPHVLKVQRALRTLLWATVAVRVLSGGPAALPDLLRLDAAGKAIPVPPVTHVMRHIGLLIRQAADWRTDATRLLAMRGPVPVAPFEELLSACRRIPVDLRAEECRLEAVVVDAGRSWCVCRGLTDGLMIGCDFCEDWFHGDCVGLTEGDIRALTTAVVAPDSGAGGDADGALAVCNDGGGAEGEVDEQGGDGGGGDAGPPTKRPRGNNASAGHSQRRAGGRQVPRRSVSSPDGTLVDEEVTAATTASAAGAPSSTVAPSEDVSGQQQQQQQQQQQSRQFRCPACSRKAGQPYAYARRMALNIASQSRTHAAAATLGAIGFLQRIAAESELAAQQPLGGGHAHPAPSVFGAALSSGVSPPPALAHLVTGGERLSGLSGLVDGSLPCAPAPLVLPAGAATTVPLQWPQPPAPPPAAPASGGGSMAAPAHQLHAAHGSPGAHGGSGGGSGSGGRPASVGATGGRGGGRTAAGSRW